MPPFINRVMNLVMKFTPSPGTNMPNRRERRWGIPVIAGLVACGGCTVQAVPHPADTPDFIWVRVGTTPQGCAQFTQKSTRPGRVANTAIWYRDAQGQYVLDVHACVPEKTVTAPESNGSSTPPRENRQ